jgi:hypothetical protein
VGGWLAFAIRRERLKYVLSSTQGAEGRGVTNFFFAIPTSGRFSIASFLVDRG